jgi:uncharacterized repeat protein (TIGR01451 family)
MHRKALISTATHAHSLRQVSLVRRALWLCLQVLPFVVLFALTPALAQTAPGFSANSPSRSPRPLARDADALPVVLQLHKIVKQAGGEESQQAATSVQPGDLLQYTANYHNPGKQALAQVMAHMVVPTGTVLVSGSAHPAQVQGSLDGTVYAPMPLTRRVQDAQGLWTTVPVPWAEVRALRWPARSLEAGERFATHLRVRVQALEPPQVLAGAVVR